MTDVCYKPAKDINPEKLEEKKKAFGEYSGTVRFCCCFDL